MFLFIQKLKDISKKDFLNFLLKASIVAFIFLFICIVGVFAYFAKDLPSPGKVNKRFVVESTKILDRTGNKLLYEIHGEEKRTMIPFQEMPDAVKYATIALEDQDFYSHYGIKMTSIIRAVMKDIINMGATQGGSTITQQFVKNSLLSPEKTLTRKIKEIILAIEIEQKFSKDEILEMYLNEIPYGSNAYGIEAAAQTFFNKNARNLTLDEATLLAALPNAPTYYSPFGSHPEDLKNRQELAIQKMANLGKISQEQAEEAKKIDVFSKLKPKKENISAPHFVMYIKEYLEQKYGEQAVEQGGLKVYTTLDWGMQEIAEKAVYNGAEKNKIYNASNASLVAIDPKTGQILSMVGSKDYFDQSVDGQVNVAIRDRQPGSSFKPYVYLNAFIKGYTPETILFDVETEFDTGTDKEYKPQNYDGKFRGPVKVKEALGMSLNIPAVKLLYLAGTKNSIALAKNMGISTLNQPDRYGLSLVLGGGEVKLLDHVNAFGTLATGGIKHNKTAILKVEDNKGRVLEEYQSKPGERVVEEKYVAMLDHILSTNDYRAPVFGSNNPLRFDNRPVAAKTGTTNEFRDGWTIGYTPSLVVGVWAGNNNNSPMKPGADGVLIAAPIWRSFMDQVLGRYNTEQFPKYEKEKIDKPLLGGELPEKKDIEVCKIPEKDDVYCLANKYCPKNEIKEKDFIEAHTILWYVKKDDPRGDYPDNPKSDPQFKNWEKGVVNWYKKHDKDYIVGDLPEDECKEEDFLKFLPTISISAPSNTSSNSLEFSANINAPYGVDKVDFIVDGKIIYSAKEKPFKASYLIPNDKNNSSLKLETQLTDKNGNKKTDSSSIFVSF